MNIYYFGVNGVHFNDIIVVVFIIDYTLPLYNCLNIFFFAALQLRSNLRFILFLLFPLRWWIDLSARYFLASKLEFWSYIHFGLSNRLQTDCVHPVVLVWAF